MVSTCRQRRFVHVDEDVLTVKTDLVNQVLQPTEKDERLGNVESDVCCPSLCGANCPSIRKFNTLNPAGHLLGFYGAGRVYLAEGPHIKPFPDDPLRDLVITELTLERKRCDTEHEVATQTDAVATASVPMPQESLQPPSHSGTPETITPQPQ